MKNGLIGPDVQRALSENYVRRFNDKLMKLCMEVTQNSEEFNIDIVPDVYQTFVDDNKIILKELPPGAEYDRIQKKITINKDKVKEDEKIPGDFSYCLIGFLQIPLLVSPYGNSSSP